MDIEKILENKREIYKNRIITEESVLGGIETKITWAKATIDALDKKDDRGNPRPFPETCYEKKDE